MPSTSAVDFRIADRLVRPSLNRVVAADQTFQVEPKIMGVLVLLAARPGQVVAKEEILASVWEGVFVTDDVLVRAIGELRRLFDDDAEAPRVIETIRKRGYRLVASVIRDELPPGGSATAEPLASAGRRWRWGAWAALAAGLAGAAGLGGAWRRGWGPRSGSGSPRFVALAGSAGSEVDPAVAPDGSRIAFAAKGDDGRADIYVKLVDADSALALTHDSADNRFPTWSPDGGRIAFARLTETACTFLVVPALGGAEKTFGPCPDREHARLAWSPDGRSLALSRRTSSGTMSIDLLDAETGERRALTVPPAGWHGDEMAAFSPDGRALAFVRFVNLDVGDVYRVATAGGEPTRVTDANADYAGLSWSGDGRRIVFSSNRAGMYSLFSVAADGGPPELVAGGGTKMKHPSASQAGDVLAYESWRLDIGLYARDLGHGAGAATARLAGAVEEWDFHPRLSPDGRKVAFASNRSGSYEIWIADRDGGEAEHVTSFDGPYVGSPCWSPDGRRLALVAHVEGPGRLYVVDAPGGAPRPLGSLRDPALPSWSRDGRSVYAAAHGAGTADVYRVDVATGRETAVTTGERLRGPGVDGRAVALLHADRPGRSLARAGDRRRGGPDDGIARAAGRGRLGGRGARRLLQEPGGRDTGLVVPPGRGWAARGRGPARRPGLAGPRRLAGRTLARVPAGRQER
jgi:Tol biopolymer transport system component/DNA-binding winged helix-turn-helix (wHTH) protein